VEPDARTELALISHVDYFRDQSARAADGAVHEEDGLFLYAGPHPLPMLVNGAIRVQPGLAAHDVLDRAKEFFRARGRGFSVYGVIGRDDDLIEAADEAGMTSFGDPAPLMVVGGQPPPLEPPSDVRLRLASTPEDVADAATVCADAYAVYGMPADVAPACLTPRAMLVPGMATIVAYDADGPVATASAFVTQSVSYVAWVGTMQRAMRRGLGGAVTRAAAAAALDFGADTTVLLASPMGAPVYRRMGFVEVGHLSSRIAMDADA
jgi:hypothetical protein